jgi:hypothetical protein
MTKKRKNCKTYHVIEVTLAGDTPTPIIQAPTYFPK